MRKLELEDGYDQIEFIPDYGFSGRGNCAGVCVCRGGIRRRARHKFY